jgi:hypothetical protein
MKYYVTDGDDTGLITANSAREAAYGFCQKFSTKSGKMLRISQTGLTPSDKDVRIASEFAREPEKFESLLDCLREDYDNE